MSGYSWAAVEDAVLGALESQIGQQVKTLKTYQGNWREDLTREGWRLPAVLVLLDGSRTEQVGISSFDVIFDIGVIVLVRQLRGEEAGRREKNGVYELLAGVRQALWHQDLGLDLVPLVLVKEEPLFSSQEFLVYGAQFLTGMVRDF